MLLDKLEAENRATRRRRLQLAGIFLGGGFVLGLFLLAVVAVWPRAEQAGPDEDVVRADNTPVARTEAPTNPDNLRASPSREDMPPVEAPDGSAGTSPEADAAVAEDSDAAREAFKTAIVSFQRDLEPEVLKPAFADWNATAQSEIMGLRDKAFEQFAQGRHADALASLNAASQRAEAELEARDDAFTAAMNGAQAAYDADSHRQAVSEIDRALQLKPDSDAAQTLNTRIAKLPEVLSALSRAAVSRVENDLVAEEAHLTTALELDPSRSELAERRTEIQIALKDREFSARIESGLQNVLAQRLDGARSDLRAARAIYPDRSETGVLNARVEALAEQLEFERLLADARAARQSDNWVAAEDLYARAGAIVPDDPQVAGGYELAGNINRLRNDLGKFLDQPERLASEAVAGNASDLVSRARDVSDLSPALARNAAAVANLIEAYATKVSVRILSDGVTRISVRGVGQVGVTTDRTIQLRPGSYTFEGTRAGFRSKLVSVDIPPGTDGLVLEIYPDEPI